MHFNTLPAGLMCGVWVAIEDVGPGQGPLLYEPGSHLRPPVDRRDASDADGAFDGRRYEDLVAARSGPMREFHAAAGDALIWAADVVHGGAAVRDRGSTRRSQVTHYFFDDATYFTPSRSDAEGGRLALREPLVDIATGRRVRPTFEGRPARVIRVGSRQAMVVDRDAPPPPWPVRLRSAALGAMVEAHYVKESVVGRATRRAVGSVR
jgi:ectoine hydroxylase-related dioxygenase (phytanoyl-CoA dioxygenase family)